MIIGVALIFWNDVSLIYEQEWIGILYALGSILIYSFGSVLFEKIDFRETSKLYVSSLMMLYAGIFALILGFIISGEITFQFYASSKYILSLLALGLYFSPVVLSAYLSLIERVGSSKASYVMIGAPLVALNISAIFEGFVWDLYSVLGVLVIIFSIAYYKRSNYLKQ